MKAGTAEAQSTQSQTAQPSVLCATCVFLQLAEHQHPCSECVHLHPQRKGLASHHKARAVAVEARS